MELFFDLPYLYFEHICNEREYFWEGLFPEVDHADFGGDFEFASVFSTVSFLHCSADLFHERSAVHGSYDVGGGFHTSLSHHHGFVGLETMMR